MLQEQDSELEQRLEGLDVDMLQDTREEATKRLEECEVAAADCRMHVKVAEGACERAAAEQKLLGEKIQACGCLSVDIGLLESRNRA